LLWHFSACVVRLHACFHFFICIADSDDGTQASDSCGLRRSCSLSDLANATPRKLLHAAPIQGRRSLLLHFTVETRMALKQTFFPSDTSLLKLMLCPNRLT
jgi:hypothetical protein